MILWKAAHRSLTRRHLVPDEFGTKSQSLPGQVSHVIDSPLFLTLERPAVKLPLQEPGRAGNQIDLPKRSDCAQLHSTPFAVCHTFDLNIGRSALAGDRFSAV